VAGGLSLECGHDKITISNDSVKIETARLEMKASKSASVSGPGPARTSSTRSGGSSKIKGSTGQPDDATKAKLTDLHGF
jgi:hypothetical protein